MPISRHRRLLLLSATLFAAVPVSFGLIRAAGTGGQDLRYLWMAAAAFLAALAVTAFARRAAVKTDLSVGRALSAMLAGALGAAAAGIVQGATFVSGIVIMAVAFGFCAGASAVLVTLFVRSRSPAA